MRADTEEIVNQPEVRSSSPRVWVWAPVAALIVANPVLHKAISDLADFARVQWGFARYDRAALIVIPLVSIAAAWPWLARSRSAQRRPATGASLLVLLALTLAAQRWLLVANIELVHFPQFALLAGLLIAAGLPGPAAYIGATTAGVLDETYQHLVIYAGRPDTYFDINDIVLNAIGAAWGVLVCASAVNPVTRRTRPLFGGWTRRRRWQGAFLTATAVAVAWWWDPPTFSPLFRTTVGGHPFYRVLSAPEGLLACGLLAGIVSLGWSRTSAAPPLAGKTAIGAAARSAWLPLIVLISGCASVPRVDPAERPLVDTHPVARSPFITTFWCGPPLAEFDAARAAEIAAAGFTVVGPPCEGDITLEANRRALDVAARHGLKMWIADARYNESASANPGWEAQVDAAVADYSGHPAFGGYFVADEPSVDEFGALVPLMSRLRDKDPDRVAYINLNPDYVFGDDTSGAYRHYVERFIAMLRPSLLSYDYYPFRLNGDRSTFFPSLTLIRELAGRHKLPFLLIVLAMPHGGYREPTEAELSWQAFHALAYGASGISYFAYWTPVNVEYADVLRFRRGLIENGRPTTHYFEAMRLNHHVRAIAAELASFRNIAVRDSRGAVAAPLPFGPIAGMTGPPVTTGFFEDDHGQLAALVVNRDYRRTSSVTLKLERGEWPPQRFDAKSGTWTSGGSDVVQLPPGGAQLIRWPESRRFALR